MDGGRSGGRQSDRQETSAEVRSLKKERRSEEQIRAPPLLRAEDHAAASSALTAPILSGGCSCHTIAPSPRKLRRRQPNERLRSFR